MKKALGPAPHDVVCAPGLGLAEGYGGIGEQAPVRAGESLGPPALPVSTSLSPSAQMTPGCGLANASPLQENTAFLGGEHEVTTVLRCREQARPRDQGL